MFSPHNLSFAAIVSNLRNLDLEFKDSAGNTAMDYARRNRFKEIVKLLEKVQAYSSRTDLAYPYMGGEKYVGGGGG